MRAVSLTVAVVGAGMLMLSLRARRPTGPPSPRALAVARMQRGQACVLIVVALIAGAVGVMEGQSSALVVAGLIVAVCLSALAVQRWLGR